MATRFLAGILSSFLFTFGAALFFFYDIDTVVPLAMFTFPTVFFIGIPFSFVIDLLMKPLGKQHKAIVFWVESLLYILAGVAATAILFWTISGSFRNVTGEIYLLGVIASYVYLLSLRFLRAKRSASHNE
ncbi:hypothetical protein ACTID9_21455 [Brevibacillus fluminis]|uniref:hypothetical protein n=1 Tax=Brevibacillus fluminis TaxID=511487 RepID=UPI003F8B20EC